MARPAGQIRRTPTGDCHSVLGEGEPINVTSVYTSASVSITVQTLCKMYTVVTLGNTRLVSFFLGISETGV